MRRWWLWDVDDDEESFDGPAILKSSNSERGNGRTRDSKTGRVEL